MSLVDMLLRWGACVGESLYMSMLFVGSVARGDREDIGKVGRSCTYGQDKLISLLYSTRKSTVDLSDSSMFTSKQTMRCVCVDSLASGRSILS